MRKERGQSRLGLVTKASLGGMVLHGGGNRGQLSFPVSWASWVPVAIAVCGWGFE